MTTVDALVCWGDVLIDGHNRYRIYNANNISFKTIEKDFANRNEAKLWILQNQLARRNLTDFQRIEIVRKCEDAVKAQAKERQLSGNPNLPEKFPEGQNKGDSRDELGAIAQVSGKTYEHAGKADTRKKVKFSTKAFNNNAKAGTNQSAIKRNARKIRQKDCRRFGSSSYYSKYTTQPT